MRPSDRAKASEVQELRAMIDALPALIGYWDGNLRNRSANSAYISYFGMTPEEIKGMHVRDVIGDELFRQNEPFMLRALAGEALSFERELTDAAGRVRYTQAAYSPDIRAGRVHGFTVLLTDVTARRTAEQERAAAEARFRTLFDHAPLGTLLVGGDGRILEANHAAVALFGHPHEQLLQLTMLDVTVPEDRPASVTARAGVVARQYDEYRLEKRYLRADGTVIWAQLDATLLELRPDGQPVMLNQIQDVTERRLQQAELERIAMIDPLTGLANRRGFIEELATARTGALLLFDLDRFKMVNDQLGHAAGDEVLVLVAELTELAALLTARVREGDVIGRIGGDEFTLLLRDTTPEQAERLAEEIGDRFEAARLGLPDQPVTLSAGVTAVDNTVSPAELLDRADRAMYANKRARRTPAD